MKKIKFLPVLFLLFLFGFNLNTLKASPGDSCSNPILLNSTFYSYTDSLSANSSRWYSFIDTGASIEIAINTLSTSTGHVHAIFLYDSCGGSILSHDSTGTDSLIISPTSMIIGKRYYLKLVNGASKTAFMISFRGAVTTFFAPTCSYTYSVTGSGINYTYSSIPLHGRYNPANNPADQPTPLGPGNFVISGLPTCINIVKAFVVYAIININPSTYVPNFTLDGTPYIATLCGSIDGSTCWGGDGIDCPTCAPAYNYSYAGNVVGGYNPNNSIFGYYGVKGNTESYYADVTSTITGNGTYTITGLPQYDNALAPDPTSNFDDVDGATLIVVYQDPSATYNGTFQYSGYFDFQEATNQTYSITVPTPPVGAAGNAFCIVSDAQVGGTNGDKYSISLGALSLNDYAAPNPTLWNAESVSFPAFNSSVVNYELTSAKKDCYNMVGMGAYYQSPNNLVVITNQNASSIIGGSGFTNETIYISGTLTVDQPTSFENCDVMLAPGAAINVLSGQELYLGLGSGGPPLNGLVRLHAACSGMWQGITIQPGGFVQMGTGTAIEDAIQGILAINMATSPYTQAAFAIGDLDMFNKCYQAIVITPTPNSFDMPNIPNATGGTMTECVITCRDFPASVYSTGGWMVGFQSYPTTTLLSPYTNNRSHIGIQAIGVDYWSEFSDVSFDNLDYGIYSIRSNLVVEINSFSNITKINGNECGVYATANASNPSSLYVDDNKFANCNIGVNAQNYMSAVTVLNNTFDNSAAGNNPFQYAVEEGASIVSGSTLSIQNNTINNAIVGISASNNVNTTATINWNTITNPLTYASLFFTGISATETSNPPGAIYSIQKNTITTLNWGIYADGLSGAFINYNPITLGNNSYVSSGFAIELLNGNSCQIADNTIIVPNNNSNWSYLGIYESQSPTTDIRCNNINYATTQIQSDATSSAGTTELSNSLDAGANTYAVGIVTSNSAVNVDGSSGHPSNNVWSTGFNCNTDMPAGGNTIWWNNSFSPENPIFGPCTGPADPFTTGGGAPCATPPPPPPPPHRSIRHSDTSNSDSLTTPYWYVPDSSTIVIMHNIILKRDTFENQDTMQAIGDEGMVKILWSNPSLLTTDSTFHHFMDSIGSTPLGKIMAIDTMISHNASANPLNGLLQSLSSISPNNNIEANMQTATSLFLDYLINGDSLSAAQISSLNVLASKCPDIDGPGVYEARALAEVFDTAGTMYSDVSCNRGLHKAAKHTSQDASLVVADIVIYPNPNNGNFTLEYNIGNNTGGIVKLYNIMGEMVGVYTLDTQEGKMSISNPEISNGVYIWKLYTNNQIMKFGKVIIMK